MNSATSLVRGIDVALVGQLGNLLLAYWVVAAKWFGGNLFRKKAHNSMNRLSGRLVRKGWLDNR